MMPMLITYHTLKHNKYNKYKDKKHKQKRVILTEPSEQIEE